MRRNVFYSSFLFFWNFYWPCPSLLWFYSEFLVLKSALDMQSHYLIKTEPSPCKSRPLAPSSDRKRSQISASEETPGPWPRAARPGCSGARRGDVPLGSPEPGPGSCSAATLLPRDDFSTTWADGSICVPLPLGEKSTDEAGDTDLNSFPFAVLRNISDLYNLELSAVTRKGVRPAKNIRGRAKIRREQTMSQKQKGTEERGAGRYCSGAVAGLGRPQPSLYWCPGTRSTIHPTSQSFWPGICSDKVPFAGSVWSGEVVM